MFFRLLLVFKNSFLLCFFKKCRICQKTAGRCTRSGLIPHAIRINPLPCQKKAVILHSHSALGSHSRYRSTKSAGDQGLCSPQKSEIFGGPKKRCFANESLIPGQRLAALLLLSERKPLSTKSPRLLHIISTIRV